jgi:hypothetical protein
LVSGTAAAITGVTACFDLKAPGPEEEEAESLFVDD